MASILQICNKNMVVTGKIVRTARIEEEWFDDVEEPEEIIDDLRQNSIKVDIFSFWQRFPEKTPKYQYYMEWDDIAVVPVKSYDYWWSKQIKARTRGLIRKAQKEGIVVKEAEFTDDFIKGMVSIFNETPVRQGRPFWHYGKSFETVKREFSRFLFRATLIGAYLGEGLI